MLFVEISKFILPKTAILPHISTKTKIPILIQNFENQQLNPKISQTP